MKKTTLLLILLCLSLSINAQTYLTENFNTSIPSTWTITDAGGATGDSWISGQQNGTNSLDGTNAAIVNSDANGNGTMLLETLTSPAFDTTGAVAIFLDFDQFYLNIGVDTAIVEVWDGTAWVAVLTQTTNAGAFNAPDEQHIDLTAYSNAAMQVRFVYNDGDTWAWYWLIDNIYIYNATCPSPDNLTFVNSTDTSANLSWTLGATETAWEIVVQPQGTGLPTGAGTPTSTNNPHIEMALTPATNYEAYVRADCGGDFSIWIGPVNFATECIIFTAPYTDGFENGGTIPLCWTMTGGEDWNFDNTPPAFGHVGNNATITGATLTSNYFAWVDASGDDGPTTLTSPLVDVSSLTTPALSFFEISNNEGNANSTLDVEVWDGAAWNPVGTYNTNTVGWELKTIDISTLTITGDVQARFIFSETITVDFYDDIAIDDVTFDELPACVIPGGITANNITGTSANITWMEGGGETAWEYVIQLAGTGAPTGAGTPSTTTGFSEINLNFETDYEVYVRSNCGVNGFSEWVGPANFTTTVQLNFTVDCAVGPEYFTYCYENNDTNVFTFTSTDGTPLNFIINSGNLENNFDELVVFDTDGTTDLNAATPYGNNGDVSGITYQSTGDTISFQVTPDGTVDCQGSANINPLDITVFCATCINQTATFDIVDDCANGDQFLIDINITSLGDAMSLAIQDNQGNTVGSISETGITQFGPYPFNTDINFIINNEQDVNCVIISDTFNIETCPPANDNCSNAISVTANADGNCTSFVSGTLFGATESSQANPCAGTAEDDVWFSFTAISTDHAINFSNIAPTTISLSYGVYEGADCNNLTNLYCSTNITSTANDLTIGNTYYIRVYNLNDTQPLQDITFDLCVFSIPPPITTNITLYTATELVEDVLIDSPCSSISNVTSSTGTDFGSDNGIGYFEANGSGFPFDSGIVMTTGNVENAPGPETGTLSDGVFNWPGDTDLETIINEGATFNASIIEFDFVPFIEDMSFEFIFAAEEYGTFQCGFSDAFAFLLTDTVTGITTNLAVIPSTTTPVSVFTIRDMAFNDSCSSENPTLFDSYSDINAFNFGIGDNPLNNPTNFRGRTVPLTAMSTVVPNRTYHIKLVVADDGDSAYDSAVFLKAGSFEIGEANLGTDILIDNGTATCDGTEIILDIGVPVGDNSIITWYTIDNGIQEPILDAMGMPENGPTLTITENGTYQVEIVLEFNTACFVIDQIIVEFLPNPVVPDSLPDILRCDIDNTGVAIFDLTENDALIIGTQTGLTISYYLTQQDAMDGMNQITNPTTYQSEPAIIYYRVENDATGCSKVSSINLALAPKPILVQAGDVLGCDTDIDGIANYNLTENEAIIVNNQTGFTFTYHTTLADAETSMNAIANPTSYDSLEQTIYIRVEDANGCFETTTINLALAPKPTLVQAGDVLGCDTDIDGIANYNLTENEAIIVNNQTGFTFTYHTTLADAETSMNAISNPTDFNNDPQTIFVRVENSEGCFEITSFNLTFGISPITSFDTSIIYEVCPNATVPITITATADNYTESEVTIQWLYEDVLIAGQTDLTLETVLLAGDYEIAVMYNDTGCTASEFVTVYELESCIIPQGISPNGDGKNDTFDLSSFDVQSLTIFNRYGVKIYEKSNYLDEWHGQSLDGDELPVGTYYYVMNYQGTKTKAAWVYINRENN